MITISQSQTLRSEGHQSAVHIKIIEFRRELFSIPTLNEDHVVGMDHQISVSAVEFDCADEWYSGFYFRIWKDFREVGSN
jgi:hypothetical protein